MPTRKPTVAAGASRPYADSVFRFPSVANAGVRAILTHRATTPFTPNDVMQTQRALRGLVGGATAEPRTIVHDSIIRAYFGGETHRFARGYLVQTGVREQSVAVVDRFYDYTMAHLFTSHGKSLTMGLRLAIGSYPPSGETDLILASPPEVVAVYGALGERQFYVLKSALRVYAGGAGPTHTSRNSLVDVRLMLRQAGSSPSVAIVCSDRWQPVVRPRSRSRAEYVPVNIAPHEDFSKLYHPLEERG